MNKSKYQLIDYWQHKIQTGEEFLSGLFEGIPINSASIIIAPTMLHSYRNIEETAFAIYPNPKSVLGFLKHLYLPTVMESIFDCNPESDYFIAEDLTDFFEQQKLELPNKIALIKRMKTLYYALDNLWDDNDEACTFNLINWTKDFNKNWLDIIGISFTFTIFTSPAALVNEVIRVYETDHDIEMLESDLGVTKEEFVAFGGEEMYTNDFMTQRFTEILTKRLTVVFQLRDAKYKAVLCKRRRWLEEEY